MKTPIFTELEMLLIEASSALDNAEAASKLGGFSLPTTDIKTRLMEKVHELRMQRMNKETA